jgi:hypothetical protein
MRLKIKALVGAVLTAGVVSSALVAAPAQAADTRPCVTRGEYDAVHRQHTQAKIKSVFDTGGYQLAAYYDGYYDYEWVEDGYWDSWYDEYSGYWYDEWVDTSYEVENWVSLKDTVRSYKKCPGFQGGRSRVGINFDNYSSAYSGMRMYSKVANTPSQLIWWNGISTFARSAEPAPGAKPQPQDTHEAKPEVTPLTADPHPNGPKGDIPQH